MEVPWVCIDQNPLAIWLRYVMMDKGGSLHELMVDKDKVLGIRLADFAKEEKRKSTDMQQARNSLTSLAERKMQSIKSNGINYYFDDSVTKEDLSLINVGMQFHISSFSKAF